MKNSVIDSPLNHLRTVVRYNDFVSLVLNHFQYDVGDLLLMLTWQFLFYTHCQLKGRKVILQTEGASIATRSMSTSVDANGDFCFKVGAGTHVIQVREIMKIIGSRFCLMKILVLIFYLFLGVGKMLYKEQNISSCCSTLRQQPFKIPLFYFLVTWLLSNMLFVMLECFNWKQN